MRAETANFGSCSFWTNGYFTTQIWKLNILWGLSQLMPQTTTHPKGLLASGSTSTFRNVDTKRGLFWDKVVNPPNPLCTAKWISPILAKNWRLPEVGKGGDLWTQQAYNDENNTSLSEIPWLAARFLPFRWQNGKRLLWWTWPDPRGENVSRNSSDHPIAKPMVDSSHLPAQLTKSDQLLNVPPLYMSQGSPNMGKMSTMRGQSNIKVKRLGGKNLNR